MQTVVDLQSRSEHVVRDGTRQLNVSKLLFYYTVYWSYLWVVDDFIRDVDSVVREVSPRLVCHRNLNKQEYS